VRLPCGEVVIKPINKKDIMSEILSITEKVPQEVTLPEGILFAIIVNINFNFTSTPSTNIYTIW
jgi:hypothetical protein